jgi:hypothetical protein
MKLEVGKRYMTREGKVTLPLVASTDPLWPFKDPSTGHSYTGDGHTIYQSDLIALYEEPTVTKSFDFDAFNQVLQKSTAICAQARKDIAAAVAAGKGETEKAEMKVEAGQIWAFGGTVYQLVAFDKSYVAATLNGCNTWSGCKDSKEAAVKGLSFAARDLRTWIANGGKI